MLFRTVQGLPFKSADLHVAWIAPTKYRNQSVWIALLRIGVGFCPLSVQRVDPCQQISQRIYIVSVEWLMRRQGTFAECCI